MPSTCDKKNKSVSRLRRSERAYWRKNNVKQRKKPALKRSVPRGKRRKDSQKNGHVKQQNERRKNEKRWPKNASCNEKKSKKPKRSNVTNNE
jgi:hypothetical protein